VTRLAAVAAVLFAGLALSAVPASAGTILAPADEAELAQSLADAQAEQGVCYGWNVYLNDELTDTGSSTGGPGRSLSETECERWAIFVAAVRWTCDSCEEEDSASFALESNLQPAPSREDLNALGYSDGDLVSDEDDTALVEMAGALPLLVAQTGQATPVSFEPSAGVPAADRPENSPGSDFMRTRWALLGVFAMLTALGPLYLLYRAHQRPTKARRRA
jgi:hypothetical protein